MKYLKYIHESFGSEYYREIPLGDLVNYTSIKLTDNVKSRIDKHLSGCDKQDTGNSGIRVRVGDDKFQIFRSDDEWYIIYVVKNSVVYKCYECDQIEGLLKCIEDKIINHPEFRKDTSRGGFFRFLGFGK